MTARVYKVSAGRFPRGREYARANGDTSRVEDTVKAQDPRTNTTGNRRPDPADNVPPEDAELEAASFVVRIWKQGESTGPECRGWVEHVQSGQRTLFLGLDRLLLIIARYVGVPIQQRGWWRSWLARWRARLGGYFARAEEG